MSQPLPFLRLLSFLSMPEMLETKCSSAAPFRPPWKGKTNLIVGCEEESRVAEEASALSKMSLLKISRQDSRHGQPRQLRGQERDSETGMLGLKPGAFADPQGNLGHVT